MRLGRDGCFSLCLSKSRWVWNRRWTHVPERLDSSNTRPHSHAFCELASTAAGTFQTRHQTAPLFVRQNAAFGRFSLARITTQVVAESPSHTGLRSYEKEGFHMRHLPYLDSFPQEFSKSRCFLACFIFLLSSFTLLLTKESIGVRLKKSDYRDSFAFNGHQRGSLRGRPWFFPF